MCGRLLLLTYYFIRIFLLLFLFFTYYLLFIIYKKITMKTRPFSKCENLSNFQIWYLVKIAK